MGKMVILASRLAESILMDWDKEDVIKLAKEVAIACHDETDFISLVRRMREAQKIAYRAMAESDDYSEALIYINKAEELEKEVDEYIYKTIDEPIEVAEYCRHRASYALIDKDDPELRAMFQKLLDEEEQMLISKGLL